MADTTLTDLIKIMRSEMKQSDEIIETQKETKASIDALTAVFMKKFKREERGGLDKLEDKIEAPKSQTGGYDIKLPDLPGKGMFDNLIVMGARLLSTINGIALGIAGVVAAFAGIRGWELDAIKNIESIGKRLKGLFPGAIATKIGDAMDLLRVSVAKFFGIDPMNGKLLANGSRVGPKGFLPKVAYAKGFTQIIGEAFDLFRSSILTKFGIDPATGKMLALTGDSAKDATPIARVIGRLGIQLRSLFKPVRAMASALGGFFKGDTFKGISKFVGAGGKLILAVFKKVFYPIGLVFSAFDGIKAFMDSDAQTIIGKLGDGVGAFVGDFIGAPFDLLKSGINWVFDKVFGVTRDENGNVTSQGWASWASTKMSEFSFEKVIGSIIAAPWKVIEAAWLWIKDLFTDPVGTIKKSWETLTGAFTSFGTFIYDSMLKPAWDWVSGIFADPVGTIKKSWETLTGAYANFGSFIYDKVLKPAWDWVSGIFTWLDTDKPEDSEGWSISKLVTGVFKSVKTFLSGMFSWTKPKDSEDSEGWGVSKLVKDVFQNVKTFLSDLFTFDSSKITLADIAGKAVDIYMIVPNLVLKAVTGIGSWLAGLFGFKETEAKLEEAGKFSISELAMKAFSGVKNWITEKFSGEIKIGNFSTNIGDIIKSVGDSLSLVKDILTATVQYEITRISNGFKNSFDRIANFINNLGDNLYIIASKNLQFELAPIAIKNPFTGNTLVEIPGFKAGVGDAETRAAAQSRIDTRTTLSQNRITARESETSAAMWAVQAKQNELAATVQNFVVNNINNSQTNANTNNARSYVATGSTSDTFDLVGSGNVQGAF